MMGRLSEQFDYMDLDDFEELLADKPFDETWELIDGRLVKMMVGARWERHIDIQNLAFGLRQRVRQGGMNRQVFSETSCMRSKAVESATLPDVRVGCGPIPPGATSFDDPLVLVEVMSRGSGSRDRLEKWHAYRRLASLQHYVLIDRDRALIEVHGRGGDAWAVRRMMEGLGATLDLSALGLSIPVAEIDQDVLPA